jgi:hypothetical protein
VSVYDSEEKAREAIARFPRIGRFIAEVRIAEGGPVTLEQTTDDPHHYDLWGEPGDILTAVVRVLSFWPCGPHTGASDDLHPAES